MGLDAQLYINPRWTVEDIKDVLKKRYHCTPVVKFYEWDTTFLSIDFEVDKEAASLQVHLNAGVGGFQATLLRMRSSALATKVLAELVRTFGGLFQTDDTTNDYEAFCRPGEGNIEFVIKQAIKDDPGHGFGDERLVDYIKEEKWRLTSDVWHKPSKVRE